MNKGRITYRFDSAGQRTVEDDTTSKEQQQQQLVPIKEEEPSDLQDEESTVAYEINKFTSDFGSWESPFDTETEKLEQLIRQPKQTPIEVSVATPVHEPPVSEHEQEVTYSSIWEEESVPSRTGGTLRYIRKSSKT